jgi:release factor glutamine methyltransferase
MVLKVNEAKANIADLLANAQTYLTKVSDTPHLEAEILLAQALTKPRSYLHTWPERIPELSQILHFTDLLEHRLAGEPIAYIIGRREFWSLDLVVTPATLIPRPETELLVELTLERLPPNRSLGVVDLGTGSGAIALAIARERPKIRILATDISPSALAIAQCNARRLGIHNIHFRQGDWCAALGTEVFDLIIANPPYLTASDAHLRVGDLRFEPRLALVASHDGLGAIRTIIGQASRYLHPGGWLLLEHGYDQGKSVCALLRTHGFTGVTDHQDAAGILRVAYGRKPCHEVD